MRGTRGPIEPHVRSELAPEPALAAETYTISEGAPTFARGR